MPRQLVRLSEVRTPQLTDDSYSSTQIQSAEADSKTTEDYLQYILSQIRLIQGTQSWKEPPAATLTGVAATMDQVQAEMAQVAALSAQVSSLATMLANVGTTYATQVSLTEAQGMIAALSTRLQAQIAANALNLGNLSTQVVALQQLSQAQATQIASLVTGTALKNSIATSTLFDQPLVGARNRLNRKFTTPNVFVFGTLRLFLNGQRLLSGATNDYVAQESATGLGYNQVVLTPFQGAPGAHDMLTADYIPVS